MAQMVENPPAVQETWVQSLGREDASEKGMDAHSSILMFLPGESRGQRSLAGYRPRGHKSQTRLSDSHFLSFQHAERWGGQLERGGQAEVTALGPALYDPRFRLWLASSREAVKSSLVSLFICLRHFELLFCHLKLRLCWKYNHTIKTGFVLMYLCTGPFFLTNFIGLWHYIIFINIVL